LVSDHKRQTMKTEYIIEFWYKCEAIDLKKSNSPLIIPNKGDSISIMTWENPNNSEGRNWWIVNEINHAIWKNKNETVLTQKIMIDIEPDPKNGLFKSDPEYTSYKYEE
jgi:hypothetical protein